ncbi:MAG: hypothetical protein WCE54_23840 [Ignavibacteriaceae bacterium]
MDLISAQEELSFIKKVIDDSKKILVIDGKDFIIWGIITALGLLITYFAIITKQYFLINWTWFILIGLGWIYAFVSNIKRTKKLKTKTFAGKMMGAIWFSMGVAATILGFIAGGSGAIDGIFISPAISTVVGVAYFLTGIVYGSKWMTGISIGWWLGAVYMFLFPGIYSLLIMAGMMLLFQIIPGIVLYRKYSVEFSGKTE